MEKTSSYWLKKHLIKGGEELSLQSHQKRCEIWVVVRGKIRARKGETTHVLRKGEFLKIDKNEKHRMYGITDATVLEVTLGEPREGDIVRYEDKYGRVK